MKAAVYHEYGSPEVFKIQEVKKPVPGVNEVLVKVFASTINYGDITARNFKNISASEFNMPLFFWLPARFFFGFSKPKKAILGNEFSGIVESIGTSVTQFRAGDHVFGYTGQNMGTYAEYICVAENGFITKKPDQISFEESACISYGALMAMNLLKKVKIWEGQKVLVIGASGGIGSAAVQLLKEKGVQVTGVCGAPGMEYIKTLGADKAIDYTKEGLTENGAAYDLIIDVLGRGSFSKLKKSLTTNGIYLLVSFKTKQLFQMLRTKITGTKKVICAIASPAHEDMITIQNLIEAGNLKSVIDKRFHLSQIKEGHFYAENGHKKGNVVVILDQSADIL